MLKVIKKMLIKVLAKNFIELKKQMTRQLPWQKVSCMSSRRRLQAFGRAEAPTSALKVRPAFAFELYGLALRGKCAKRTGQLQRIAKKPVGSLRFSAGKLSA